MKIRYSNNALNQFAKIHKGDRKSTAMITRKLEQYAEHQSSELDVRILKGRYDDMKRLRVGNYRIIFEETGEEMLVYEIRHRQEAYND